MYSILPPFFFGFTRDGSVFIRCFVSGSLQQIEWSSCTCCGKICLSSTRDFPNARHIKQFHYFTLMTSRVSFHHMKRNRVTTARLAAQSSLNLLFSVTNQFVPRTMWGSREDMKYFVGSRGRWLSSWLRYLSCIHYKTPKCILFWNIAPDSCGSTSIIN